MIKPNIKVTNIEVAAVQPDASDLRKIRHYAQTLNTSLKEVTTVYKIYIDTLPEPSGQGIELFFGEHQIHKYSEFKGGLFFVVNDPAMRKSLVGSEIGFRIPGETEILRTGIHVPDMTSDMISDVLTEKVWTRLPSKQEFLTK